MKYYIIAGEASGDLHGSNLIKGLCAEDPDAEFRLWGGSLMLDAALPKATLVRDYREGAVMGITDVLAKAGKLLGRIRFCKRDILEWKPDVVILIDYPGFNMKIAQFCHENGIRVFYYIAPKTWASREGRNRKLRAWVDRLFIVFPFEIPYFEKRGIPFTYRGNPLLDAVDSHSFSRPCEGKYIAILPGSRSGEISRMMPVCAEAARRLSARGYRFIIAGAPSRSIDDYEKYIADLPAEVVFGRTYDVLKYADAAIINSGTASLEAALIGTPQVVCWSTSRLTYLIAKYVLRVMKHVKYISLGNLCVDAPVFRELIQDDFNAEDVSAEVLRLTQDSEYRSQMQEGYARIRASLGGSGASRAVAHEIIAELSACE